MTKKKCEITHFNVRLIVPYSPDYIIYFDNIDEFYKMANTFEENHIYHFENNIVFMAGGWVYWYKDDETNNKNEY